MYGLLILVVVWMAIESWHRDRCRERLDDLKKREDRDWYDPTL